MLVLMALMQQGPTHACLFECKCSVLIAFCAFAAAGLCAGRALSVALMPRSLLVFSGEAYEQCLHGIDEVRAPTSLTFSC